VLVIYNKSEIELLYPVSLLHFSFPGFNGQTDTTRSFVDGKEDIFMDVLSLTSYPLFIIIASTRSKKCLNEFTLTRVLFALSVDYVSMYLAIRLHMFT